MRTTDKDLVLAAMSQYPPALSVVDPESWLMWEDNVALTNDNNDVAMFERCQTNSKAVYGHYFFWSRGKEAVKAGEKFLEELFTNPYYGVEIIVGLPPKDHKAAVWMTRRLGFKEIETMQGPMGDIVMFTLTKQDWEQR